VEDLLGSYYFWPVKDVFWLGGYWQSVFVVEDHMVLLGEERYKNATTMDKAREVWSKENVRIFPCINVALMEEARKANLEENIRISNGLEEGVPLTTTRGDEEMEEGMKNVPCMKRMEWCGRKCELVYHVGEIIVEGRIVAYDPRELILDNDLGETKVGVTILSYPKVISQIMTIWR
jgi:hypothetical protein